MVWYTRWQTLSLFLTRTHTVIFFSSSDIFVHLYISSSLWQKKHSDCWSLRLLRFRRFNLCYSCLITSKQHSIVHMLASTSTVWRAHVHNFFQQWGRCCAILKGTLHIVYLLVVFPNLITSIPKRGDPTNRQCLTNSSTIYNCNMAQQQICCYLCRRLLVNGPSMEASLNKFCYLSFLNRCEPSSSHFKTVPWTSWLHQPIGF